MVYMVDPPSSDAQLKVSGTPSGKTTNLAPTYTQFIDAFNLSDEDYATVQSNAAAWQRSDTAKQKMLADTITGHVFTDNSRGFSEGTVGGSSFRVQNKAGEWVDLETHYANEYGSDPYLDTFSKTSQMTNLINTTKDYLSAIAHEQKLASVSNTTTTSPRSAGASPTAAKGADGPSKDVSKTIDLAPPTQQDQVATPSGSIMKSPVMEYISARNIAIVLALFAIISIFSWLLGGEEEA